MYASVKQFAEMQGVGYGRIHALIQLGMPCTHLVGGPLVIPIGEAIAWREARRARVGRPRKQSAVPA